MSIFWNIPRSINPLERTEQISSTSLVNVLQTLESSSSEIQVNDSVNKVCSNILEFLRSAPNLLVNTSESTKQYLNYLGKNQFDKLSKYLYIANRFIWYIKWLRIHNIFRQEGYT